ncbi:hypothetical protein [Massilia aquatica]|uniref:Flagellar FliJ protein n=1 Tax=Massilia aquatica TaxID=2609000 RepID=A0ABX0MI34_9BURK|nr:hypothetical protein [Massilia aquatica]NHZ44587.1 hypothetical protein [Massilia aquatica]
MLSKSHLSNLVKLETEFNAAVENRVAAREAADSVEFRWRALLEMYEHADKLQRALKKNRFHEEEALFATVYRSLAALQTKTEVLYRSAEVKYENAHTAAKKDFYLLEEARKSAALSTLKNEQLATEEIQLKDL